MFMKTTLAGWYGGVPYHGDVPTACPLRCSAQPECVRVCLCVFCRYFVSRFAGDAWTRLPNVTPHQVSVARKLRRVLTGRLDAAVGGHPPFPGTEASYLRARIALITADTVVSPVGEWVCVSWVRACERVSKREGGRGCGSWARNRKSVVQQPSNP